MYLQYVRLVRPLISGPTLNLYLQYVRPVRPLICLRVHLGYLVTGTVGDPDAGAVKGHPSGHAESVVVDPGAVDWIHL